MVLGKVTLTYILTAGVSYVLATHNFSFHLSSEICFHIIKPFRENLLVHYDRKYLLNGGVPNILKGGLYFQGPHKVVGKAHFKLIVSDLTRGELLDSSFLYIFFHKDLVYSGCLHNELNNKNYTRVKGPGVPYDINHGKHGVPSELWYKKLDFDRISKKANVEFGIDTNRKCPFGVLGIIYTSDSAIFHQGILQSTRKVRCPKGNYFRASKDRKKSIRFTV